MSTSMKPIRRRFAPAPVLIALIALFALAPSSSARDSGDPVEARNGLYGKLSGTDYVYFRIRDRRVSELNFNMVVRCFDSETGDTYERFFDGAELGGGRVRDNGVWRKDFVYESNGREGQVNAEIDFRNGRPLASFSVIVPNAGTETCDGFMSLRARRGS